MPAIPNLGRTPTKLTGQRTDQKLTPPTTEKQIVLTNDQVSQVLLEPVDYWNRAAPPLGVLDDTFHLYLIQHDATPTSLLDPLVEEIDWDDSSGYLMGSLTLRDPEVKPHVFNVKPGDFVALWVRDGDGRFKEWWRMRVMTPQVDYLSGSRTFALASDLHRLFDSLADMKYVKGKAHPAGWTAQQVFDDLGKIYGYDVSPLPALKTRMVDYTKTGVAPSAVIEKLLDQEHKLTGIRYLLTYDFGWIGLRTKQRSVRMLELGPLLIQAGYQATLGPDFATAIHLRTSLARSKVDALGVKHAQTTLVDGLRAYIVDQAGVDRYGLVTKMGWLYVDSKADMVVKGTQHLALAERPEQTISATHPGVVGLRRFDAVKVQVRSDPTVFQRVLFVNTASYVLSSGTFDMTVALGVDDPQVNLPVDLVFGTQDEATQHQTGILKRGKKPKPLTAPSRADLGDTATPITGKKPLT